MEQIILECKQNNCKLVFAALEPKKLSLLNNAILLDKNGSIDDFMHATYSVGLNDALATLEDNVLSLAANEFIEISASTENQILRTSSSLSFNASDNTDEDQFGFSIGFRQCLETIQEKLHLSLDLDSLDRLSTYCKSLTFKKGEKVNVHLADLVDRNSFARNSESSPNIETRKISGHNYPPTLEKGSERWGGHPLATHFLSTSLSYYSSCV
jgi:hypothetical protein